MIWLNGFIVAIRSTRRNNFKLICQKMLTIRTVCGTGSFCRCSRWSFWRRSVRSTTRSLPMSSQWPERRPVERRERWMLSFWELLRRWVYFFSWKKKLLKEISFSFSNWFVHLLRGEYELMIFGQRPKVFILDANWEVAVASRWCPMRLCSTRMSQLLKLALTLTPH